MKKLLIVSSDSIHVYNYIRLIEADFDEILLLSNAQNANFKHPTVVLDFSIRNPIRAWRTAKRIREILLSFQPDVFHVHQANSFAFLSFWCTGGLKIPRILTAWGSDVLLLPKQNFLMKLMVTYSLRVADGLTADANFVADEIHHLLQNKNKEVLIANFGIQLEIKSEPKQNIIYSNRLHKKLYRVDHIIKAFHKFVNQPGNESWLLVIAATGEESESLLKLVDQLGISNQVEFVGWIDKETNASYYAKAKIFISIPESDATSISLLEAMASGCFPVLSDLPANKQWVKHLENGYIVKDLSADFFSDVLKLNMDKALEYNKGLVELHGTMQANRNKFMNLYNTLLRK